MLSKFKKFISTHIPHILSTFAIVLFVSLALSMVYSARNTASQEQANLVTSQLSSSNINSKNATKLVNALKANDNEEAEKLLTSLQKSLSAQNQNLAVTSSNLETQNDTYSIFGIIVPGIALYALWGLAALSVVLLIFFMYRSSTTLSVEDTQSYQTQQHTQQALLEFLEVIQALSEGD
ncbi:MAG: methyl-accepting chemotaxis protein, partial [Wohlfahrtiimonas sp.]